LRDSAFRVVGDVAQDGPGGPAVGGDQQDLGRGIPACGSATAPDSLPTRVSPRRTFLVPRGRLRVTSRSTVDMAGLSSAARRETAARNRRVARS